MRLIEKIGPAAMLEQTAEECVELAQACLKYARYLRGENPTFKNVGIIKDNMMEEIADVMICISELNNSEYSSHVTVSDYIGKKAERMRKRFGDDKEYNL